MVGFCRVLFTSNSSKNLFPINLAALNPDKRTVLCVAKGVVLSCFETQCGFEVTVIPSRAVPLQKLDNPRCEKNHPT